MSELPRWEGSRLGWGCDSRCQRCKAWIPEKGQSLCPNCKPLPPLAHGPDLPTLKALVDHWAKRKDAKR